MTETRAPSRGQLLVTLLCGAAGVALLLGMFFLQRRGIQTVAVVTELSPAFALKLAAIGALAAAAMLIPGISGAFVLLVLGAYQTVLQAVADFNIPLLFPVGLGVGAGLVLGARLIAWLLERFPAPMYGFILGLVASSAVYLYPRTCQPLAMRARCNRRPSWRAMGHHCSSWLVEEESRTAPASSGHQLGTTIHVWQSRDVSRDGGR